ILLSVTVTISPLSWWQTKSEAGGAEKHPPKRWQFTMPQGDVAKGRGAFEKFACYVCHEGRGGKFPRPAPGSGVGPELSPKGAVGSARVFYGIHCESERSCGKEIPQRRR